ncbi:hypothetical protein GOP47_0010257 [Adiantum capillus-veneris]|uniref:Protein kinase domain-containing protein n=1 Tax=Adiantum capillus-veneris TaxID=13818 RepID=A0A9D4UUR1_ADICA|nr:hypothetical protein GOP47_0010257 [Adiantum capillus-veneris]
MKTPAAATGFLLLINCLLLLSQILIFANSSSTWNTSAAAVIPSPELYALLELKARLANSAASQALDLRAWNESNLQSICNNVSSWRGVTCSFVSGQCHITGINLTSSGLAGSLPPHLGNLTFLSTLDLSSNLLMGGIPVELSRCSMLQLLCLHNNSLKGPIPASLGNCTSLVDLQLYSNQLSGRIPDEIGLLGKLQRLLLRQNKLLGAIPSSLGMCRNLLLLDLHMNQLKGGIPEELGALTSLTSLCLHHNNFMGAIPRNLSNCTSLIIIELGSNELSGSIPTELGELAQLQRSRLWKNNLNGIIPESLGNCKELVTLELTYNQLSGDIPWDTLSNCSLLRKLDLSYNQLVGRLSSKLGRLLYLQHLHLEYNLLQGPIPDLVLGLSNLQTVDLSFNHLDGALPKNLPNVFGHVIVSLKVSHNLLSGNLPPWFGQLMMVEEIDLSHNRFAGTIPENLGDSMSLKYLNLSGNCLNGEIPLHLSNIPKLISLDLSSNELTGLLPSTLQHLQFLNVSFNNFEGPIPISGVFEHLDTRWLHENSGSTIRKLWTPPHGKAHLGLKITILIALATLVVVIWVALLAILYYTYWRKSCLAHEVDQTIKSLEEMRHFSAKGLWESTEGYSRQNLLGEGASGVVYKGVLSNGKVVAVKKFNDDIACAREALLQEVHILSKVRHRNLVKVLGCVLNLEVSALVLQFMPNGSLEQYLCQTTNEEENKRLSWDMILKVAQGVANALAYLHHEYDVVPIIHGDVKPGNILLDSEFEAHLADFGLAKLAKRNTKGVSLTSHFKGSIGYMAPELAYITKMTTKVDIYGFGVVILEMVTGIGPTHDLLHGMSLHEWVKHKILPLHNI